MTNRVGHRLGNYRLIGLLGRGGFAEVYLGEHVFLKTLAAIKVLRVRLADDDMEGFLKEARTIAGLNHPNIVRVLEFGMEEKVTDDDGNAPFLVMDYAPNGVLRRLYPKGTILPLVTIVSYVKQVAAALQYAHDKKVIHRDVKPENLLMGSRYEVLLSDFGTAMIFQTPHNQSVQGMAGTVNYMAPEQIRGMSQPASDQYGLGVVVYEWLCGRCPFEGSFYELSSQHIFAAPPSLHERVLTIPLAVEQVVMQALAKDPLQRFASVQAFADALEQAVWPMQRPGPRTHILTPPSSAPSLHPYWSGEHLPPVDAALSPAVSPQVMNAYSYDTVASPISSDVPQPINTPEPVRPAPQKRARQRFSRRSVLAGLLSLAGVTVIGGGGALLVISRHLSVSATNKATTKLQLGATVFIYRGHTDNVYTVAWSPVGQRIASGGHDQTARLWNAFDGSNSLTYKQHFGSVNALAWSPRGERIVSGYANAAVQVWEAATGKLLFPYEGHTQNVRTVAWSPIGTYIASGGDDKTVQVWGANTGKYFFTYTGHEARVWGVTWSPDGKRIASAGDDKTVRVWEINTGRDVFHPYTGHKGAVKAVAWSHNGRFIASAGDDRTVQVWDATTGGHIFTYYGHNAGVYALAWSPDDGRIVSGSTPQVQVWDALSGEHAFTYTGHTDDVHAVAWSYDGKFIASGANDNVVRVWRAV